MAEEFMKPSTAVVVFAITSGIAGGLAQLLLNKKIKDAPAVNYGSVVIAASVSFLATFFAIQLVKTVTAEEMGVAYY